MKWSKEEISYLVENYSNESNLVLSKLLNRTKTSIDNKARELKLEKNKKYISIVNSNRSKNEWSKEEIDYLKNNYTKFTNKELSKKLNKTKNSIGSMAQRLELTNIDNIKKYSKKYLLKESKKYRTKQEFRLSDPNLYAYAHRINYIDESTTHMITTTHSIPQLICESIFMEILKSNSIYNDRKTIQPYELDIYFPKYKLAIEYNGKYWHELNDNTNIKKEICERKNITLLIIDENNLKRKNINNYISNIKLQIIENINLISELLNENIEVDFINSISIDFNQIYGNLLDIDELYDITRKYDNLKYFREDNPKLYRKLCYIGQLEEYTSHMKKYNKQ